MLQRLMPRSDGFFDDFDAQCTTTLEGTRLLHALLSDYRDVGDRVRALQAVEHRGDAVAKAAFTRLHREFITPFERIHIHALVSRIDGVLDQAHAAASRLHAYELPECLPEATELARLLVLCAEQLRDVVTCLRAIKQPERILTGCEALRQLRGQADAVLGTGLGRLFRGDLPPFTVMKWKGVYDLLETALDRCVDVVQTVEAVVLEHS
ncbi:DUF47 family protein [Corallococcus sp. CA054B]|uniref:DUF47 domain-containing protein n=1 Tax=Corallococcus sp. CA054B TaxID=2316734 RepID=UPI000EA1A7BC|nr:DUF47 family protein [Corallococcus sp. CA054B]RKG64071.1 DUF47 family protein [Corallococcus sp. CA054B]